MLEVGEWLLLCLFHQTAGPAPHSMHQSVQLTAAVLLPEDIVLSQTPECWKHCVKILKQDRVWRGRQGWGWPA